MFWFHFVFTLYLLQFSKKSSNLVSHFVFIPIKIDSNRGIKNESGDCYCCYGQLCRYVILYLNH